MICDRYDVVVVPFPFTDRETSLRRPALVLSEPGFNAETRQTTLAMITRAGRSSWPSDTQIADLAAAGLDQPCVTRMKLFTLANDLLVRRIGGLGEEDRMRVRASVSRHFELAGDTK